MAVLPINIARVSDLLQTSVADQSISGTQAQLLTVENELSTGKQVSQPSDNPLAAGLILNLQKTLAQRTAYAANINTASSNLGAVGDALTNLSNLLLQAQNIASKDVNTGSTQAQRTGDAQVVNSLLSEIKNLANTQNNGVYLFGGDKANQAPYVNAGGGVQFVGSTTVLQNTIDQNLVMPTELSGANVFGGLSTRILGSTTAPATTTQTQLTDLHGANNNGINLGTIKLGNGATSANIDLSKAQTLGDVVNAINTAAVGGITAALTTTGINLTGAGTDDITVTDVSGTAASDLGIATAPGGAGAGAPVNGSPLNPRLTLLTPISALNGGAGLDSSGIILSNGVTSKTITFPPGGDVQSILNAINGAGLGATAQINSTANGINVLNSTQGTTMTIGENGGLTATELGIRTFTPTTNLSELNNGQGVGTAASGSVGDFTITDSNGAKFTVSTAGATTVQDVINAINTAATTATAGVTASFATTGNGIVLTDTAGGAGTLTVQPINASSAAADLGLTKPASGNVITGADVDGVQSAGVFTDLTALAQALQTGNLSAITAAGKNIQTDYNNATNANGVAGAQVQSLTDHKNQLDAQNLATEQLLSNIQDVDMTAAVSQFQTLQTALQASLLTTARAQSLTLLNFL